MLIFMADTVHRSTQLSPDTVPYNVARIAAFCQARHGEVDYRLFKDPHVLLDRLRAEQPDILALSHYFWNTSLNHRIAAYARRLYPDLLIVTGGPNLDRNEAAYRAYARQRPMVDMAVTGEGETAFEGIVAGFKSAGRIGVCATPPAGTVALFGADGIKVGPELTRTRSLDEFPSPYLNGMLDPFLAQGLRPMIETVRGCPYQCAFCEQGSEFFTKIARASEAKVYEEIDYIRPRTSASQLILADVNFGILKRDLDVARYLKKLREEHGWPESVYVYNAKLPTESTLQTMEALYPMCQFCMSFQSTDLQVLRNIHRENIGFDKYSAITHWAKARDFPVGTELIYGLPGETRESFMAGYDTLLAFKADYLSTYNLRLFPGTELNTAEARAKWGFETRFRPMDINIGEYRFEKTERIFEVEEIVLATASLTQDDFFFARRIGFMIEALWNTGYLRPALAFLASRGHSIGNLLRDLIERARASDARSFFDEYDQMCRDELLPDLETVARQCEDDQIWDDLVHHRGANIKINLAFAGRLMFFDNPLDLFFFADLAKTYGPLLNAEDRAFFDDILRHCRASKTDFDNPAPRRIELTYDIPAWAQATYPDDIAEFKLARPAAFIYALDETGRRNVMNLRADLERQGISRNGIAERLFFATTALQRSGRLGVREDGAGPMLAKPDGALEARMSWSGGAVS